MGEDYDLSKPDSFIHYTDVNNLYGWAQCQPLPYGGFQWVHPSRINLKRLDPNRSTGYFLEVDLKYPEDLHDKFSELPPAPTQTIAPGSKHPKLMATLHPKEKYVVHHSALIKYMELGVEVTKVHRVLRFWQKPWMRDYINLNTEARKQAKNDFEKTFYKLMNNSVSSPHPSPPLMT